MNLLEVRNLKINFWTEQGTFSAVDSITFTLRKGEILALIGESGCGKSITALSIMNLLPYAAETDSASSIRFNDRDLLKCTPREMEKIRGKEIGMVFQEPMTSLNPVLTIGKQINEIFETHYQLKPQEIKEKTFKILKKVQLPDPESVYSMYPYQLSGGMRQRVVIGMAIAANPPLLIADEPTTALDVTIQAEIIKLFESLNQQDDRAMIFISHNLLLVKSFAQRIAIMYLGEIVEQASTEEIFKHPKHPYTKGLLQAIPVMGKEEELKEISGSVPPISEIPRKYCRFYDRCPYRMDRCLEAHPDFYGPKEHPVRCYLYEKD